MLLAGDIGGTKTILALYDEGSDLHNPLVETRFASSRYASLDAVIEAFLQQHRSLLDQRRLTAAAFGIAGPIAGQRAQLTNLSWVIEADSLALTMGIPLERVRLLNDLEAIATSVPRLDAADDLFTLYAGEPVAQGSIAVIAPGTGLGESYLTWHGDRYHAYPSEGGHAGFSPQGKRQLALLNFLYEKYDHVSTERVCSGIGIPNIYSFLKSQGILEPDWLAEAIASSDDPVPVIINNALDGERPCDICQQTLDLFVSILAAEASDAALIFMATGGVYLGGGIPPRILPALQTPHFRAVFCSKGRFTQMMQRIPVHVIMNSKAALLGAAVAGSELLS